MAKNDDNDKRVTRLERKLGRVANVIYAYGMTHNDMHLVEMVKGAMDDDDDDAVDNVPPELTDADADAPAPPPPPPAPKAKPRRGVV